MMNHMVWVGVKPNVLASLKEFTRGNGRFNSIDELSNDVADVEIEPEMYH